MRVKTRTEIGAGQRGFTMVEMLVVIAIIMIISAMAMPNIMNTVQLMRMRSSGTSIAGLFEQARMSAIQQNKNVAVRNYLGADNRLRYYIDISGNNTYTLATNEPIVVLPDGYRVQAAPPAGIANKFPAGVTISVLGAETEGTTPGTFLAFNSRGLPCAGTPLCKSMTGANNTAATNYVTYFTDGRQTGAVAIYQTGKVKVYVYNGSSYQ